MDPSDVSSRLPPNSREVDLPGGQREPTNLSLVVQSLDLKLRPKVGRDQRLLDGTVDLLGGGYSSRVEGRLGD